MAASFPLLSFLANQFIKGACLQAKYDFICFSCQCQPLPGFSAFLLIIAGGNHAIIIPFLKTFSEFFAM